MNLFGLSFLLFILKWSAGKGFWYQLQVTDKPTFKKAIAVERTRKKVEKCKLNIIFFSKMSRCESTANSYESKMLQRNG